MKVGCLRDEQLNEFYTTPTNASNLKIFQIRGLAREHKWNKLEIKLNVESVFFRKNVNVDRGFIIPPLHLSSQ